MFATSFQVARCAVLVAGVGGGVLLAAPAWAEFTIFSFGGDTPASIQPTVDAFRSALGNPNNVNNPGPIVGGRREINWDGGAATMASPVGTPMTTFQNNRGATFTTPGTGFVQTPLTDTALTDIQPTYATTFGTFSAQRIFTPLGSNITDATFSVPGSGGATPATVSGFGAVFSDVDIPDTTKLEFFDIDGMLLRTLNAPIDSVVEGGLSFIGGVANDGERIARVRITTGNMALGPIDANGNPADVVVMDDFLYAEPVAVPEPATGLIAIAGLAAAALCRRLRG